MKTTRKLTNRVSQANVVVSGDLTSAFMVKLRAPADMFINIYKQKIYRTTWFLDPSQFSARLQLQLINYNCNRYRYISSEHRLYIAISTSTCPSQPASDSLRFEFRFLCSSKALQTLHCLQPGRRQSEARVHFWDDT